MPLLTRMISVVCVSVAVIICEAALLPLQVHQINFLVLDIHLMVSL